MPNENQAITRADIDLKIKTTLASYPGIWAQMIAEWRGNGPDSAWLMYSANYLFRTAGIRWAMDPYTLLTRLKQPQLSSLEEDLTDLKLVVLTHAHADHLDLNLIVRLQHLPIQWIIPNFMLDLILPFTQMPEDLIHIPVPGKPIQVGGLTLTPFEGQHIRNLNGVPEMGYIAEFNGKCWLFPADTRVFNISRLPLLPRVSGVFAHCWLGKASATQFPPPLLDEFCAFYAATHAEKMIVTHLEELGRKPEDYWSEAHFEVVQSKMNQMAPDMKIQMAKCGQRVDL